MHPSTADALFFQSSDLARYFSNLCCHVIDFRNEAAVYLHKPGAHYLLPASYSARSGKECLQEELGKG